MIKKVMVLCLLAALPVVSFASNFSYSQVNASFVFTQFKKDVRIDPYELDSLGGLSIDGSWQFHNNFFVGLSTASQGAESSDEVVELTLSQGVMYLGGVYPINDQLDLFAAVGVGNQELEICSNNICFKDDADITELSIGARFKLTEVVELNTSYSRVNYDDSDADSDSIVSLGGAWWHSSTGSVYLDYSVGEDFDEDVNRVELGYRYSFER